MPGGWRMMPAEAVRYDGSCRVAIPPEAGRLLLGHIAELQEPLFPEEAEHIRRAVDKRRREFCAGRILARQALCRLGLTQPGALPVREDRVPEWPAGFLGSIAHTDRFCACAVARRAAIRSVGIDLETCGQVKPELWDQLFCAAEKEKLLAVEDKQLFLATLMFCAKEAFYKLQYTLTSAWLGFTDVTVVVDGQDRLMVTPAEGTPAAKAVPFMRGSYSQPFPDTVMCQCWLV
ncbi:MAG: hypothetical protein A2340_16005 [Lentisphaerae bacterium RIFOXYB12_FULL_60_10]|nr:MAG: hypothetical protein A2340_16005 [Lentisphaerae bacterium RIFOXYB12_FULL_60_10]